MGSEELKDEVVPPEINLRGKLALEIYNKALTEGKTSVRRVPVMLIGQDRSGKTSLKNSLQGIPFNPDEDSTIGIDVNPTYFKVTTEIWKTGESDQATSSATAISFDHQVARLVVNDLKKETFVREGGSVKPMQPSDKPLVDTVSSSAHVSSDVPSSPHFSAKLTKNAPSNEKPGEDAESIQASKDSRLRDRNDVPDASVQEKPNRNDRIEGHSPRVPDEIATLIKKLLQDVEKMEDEEDIYSVLWDFGGQSVYCATHPLLLTAKAIYLLVCDLSRDPHGEAKTVTKQGMSTRIEDSWDAKTNLDHLYFWMTSISSLASEDEHHQRHPGPESGVLPETLPPVFLVCTHADKPFREANPLSLAFELFGALQEKPYKTQLYKDVFVVDNTISGHGEGCSEVARLRSEILAAAKELPQMKEVIPVKWLKYEKALQTTKKEGYKYISLEMAKQIASDVCHINDDQEILTLLNVLHDQRILIHFDDTDLLNKLVVLDPQWLIDVFKKVITVKPCHREKKEIRTLWKKLYTEGILEERLLQHVWSPLLDQETADSLIEIMETFCLLCPLSTSDASRGKQYLVPSMLMSHPPQDVINLIASAQIPSLCIKFESGLVPPGLFPRLVLKFFQWGKDQCWSQENPQLFFNFARFFTSEDEDCSVILLCHSSYIEVVVYTGNFSPDLAGGLKSTMNISADDHHDAFEVVCARAVRRQLGLLLECMRKEFCWMRNVKYEVGFMCPVCCQGRSVKYCCTHHKKACTQEECLHFWSEFDLRSDKQVIRCRRCPTVPNDRVKVIGFSPWFATPGGEVTTDEGVGRRSSSEGDYIPTYVLARGEKALAAYHRALASGWTYDKRVKILLVGQDRVGKTSLSKSLRGEPFNDAEQSTEGVQMIPPVKNAGSDAWKNPTSLEHTSVFDHKISSVVTEELISTQAELSSERLINIEVTKDQDIKGPKKTFQKNGETKEHAPIHQPARSENSQQETLEGNPRNNPATPGRQRTHSENTLKDTLEGNLKQNQETEPFRVTPKDEVVMPQETAFLIEENLKKNEVDQDDKIWPVIWDFAGQDIYRAIHPLFMSSEDIYLLVFDLTKKLTSLAECRVNLNNKEYAVRARDSEDTNLDHLLRWMDLIHSLKKCHRNEESSSKFEHPPVIMVGTHADRVDPSKEIEMVTQKCSRVLRGFSEHIVKCLPIDNTKAGKREDQEKIRTLRDTILDLADKMPHTKKEIPLQWHRVEKQISKLTWPQEKYLHKKIFHEKIVSRYCKFDNKDDFDELLHFLHARGSIFYHEYTGDEDGLVVLDPQWLINVLCEIIKVTPCDDDTLPLSQDRTDLREKGILRRRLLNNACKNQNLDPIKDSLISLMEKFNLICKWLTSEPEDSIILVPCMLTAKSEEGNIVDHMTNNCLEPVYLTFDKTNYVPGGLFCRLVVLFGKWLSDPQYTHQYSLHANEARFALDQDGHFVILVCYKTVIKLHIDGPVGSTPSKHCRDVLCHLMKFMKKLRERCHWLKTMSAKVCALCTICEPPCERHDVGEKVPCQRHDCAHYIPLKSKVICCGPGRPLPLDSLHSWIETLCNLEATGKSDENQCSAVTLNRKSPSCNSTMTTPKRKKIKIAATGTSVKKKSSSPNLKRKSPCCGTSTPNRKKLKSPGTSVEKKNSAGKRKRKSPCRGASTPTRKKPKAPAPKEGQPSDDELEELSELLGLSWEKLARRLGFKKGRIDGFRKDNEELSKKAFDMLIRWKEKGGADATYSVLYDALCHELVQQRDLAETFCCN